MTRRTLRAHLAFTVGLVAAAVAAFAGLVYWFADLAFQCAPDYSESTIIAPESYRGRLLCAVTDGEVGTSVWASGLLALLPLVALVAAAAAWVRHRRVALVLACCLTAVALPWGIRLTTTALPADCTDAQWKIYGSPGCERNEELRPGLGQYDRGA